MISVSTRAGSGPGADARLVLAPSLGTTSRIWSPALRALLDREPHLVVELVELPGHAGRAASGEPFTIEDLTDALAEHLTTVVDPHLPLAVAGVSLGGALALDAARRYPQLVDAFAMIASNASFPDRAGWDGLIAAVRANGTASLREPSLDGWFADRGRDLPLGVADAIMADLAAVDDAGYIGCCEALARFDAWDDLATIDVPAWVVAATGDRTPSPEQVRALSSRLPQSTYAELEGGHLAVVEQPGRTADLLGQVVEAARVRHRSTT